MTEEKSNYLSEQDSLRLITEMIQKAKNSYVENGLGPLAWGILITFCSLTTFVSIQWKLELPFDIWLLAFLAIGPQVYFSRKSKEKRQFRAFEEQVMDWVWTTYGITIILAITYTNLVSAKSSSSLLMILYGIPTFITGGVRKFPPMIIGGIICWVLAVVSMFTPTSTDMLLMAVSATVAWLIPGIILRRKYLKLTHV